MSQVVELTRNSTSSRVEFLTRVNSSQNSLTRQARRVSVESSQILTRQKLESFDSS